MIPHTVDQSDTDTLLPLLPISVSSFSKLRANHKIYVDKTALIYQLARYTDKFFLARPRRFGKSLLVSTLDSLFRNGTKEFQGLAIESLWQEKTYNVVRLDLLQSKSFNSFSEFQEDFRERLELAFAPYGFVFDPSQRFKFYPQLSRWLQSQPISSLVLLIDEYDAPLCMCLNNPELFTQVRNELASFYAEVKSHDEAFRFTFLTGITKFSQAGIFSELNDVTDISLDPKYGTLLGYTENEIKHYFAKFLKYSATQLHLSEDELLKRLTLHYDGFCFDETASIRVFNPWSVMQFLRQTHRGFQNYWIETGGLMTALINYFKSHSLKNPAEFQEEKSITKEVLSASMDQDSISDIALLTQTGYLTIKKYLNGCFYVGYPNLEVTASMAALYSELLLGGKNLNGVNSGAISEVLAHGSDDDILRDFNRLFAALDYLNYPVRNESVCRGYLQVLLYSVRLYAQIEVHSAFGRSDLEVDAGNRHWVFELKFLPKSSVHLEKDADRLLTEAQNQIITRKYGMQNIGNYELHRAALVFSEEQRQFIRWKSV